MKKELLDIVNEQDEVIGQELRERVHKEGLLHREVHVWFITPSREIVFQHRAKDKDTRPDKLDATVGGHVDPGYSYEGAAIKECEEETGLSISISDLKLVRKHRKKAYDKDTGMINNCIRYQYVYLFKGKPEDLRVEEGKSQGFEFWSIDSLKDLSEEDKERFISSLSDDFFELFEKGQKILGFK